MRRIALLLLTVAFSFLAAASSCGHQAPPSPAVASVRLRTADGSPPTLAALGATLQLSADALDASGAIVAAAGIAFSSADSTIATVSDAGLVTAVANGSVKITASSHGHSADLTVLVQQAANSIAIVPPSGSLERGATLLLHASALDVNGHPISGPPAWSSADATIASVDASGTVTGVAIGSTTIQAAFGTSTASAAVQVVKPAVASVTVAGTTHTLVSLGDTVQLSATALDARGNAVEATAFTWSSSAPGVVSVGASSGLATAVANGTATITATGGGHDGTFSFTVQQVVAQVMVAGAKSTLTSLGDTLQLTAAPLDARGHAVSSATVTWAACDGTSAPPCTPTIVQVDGTGLVTAKANGSARVFATASGISGSFALTVAQAVDSVSVSPSSVTLAPAATQQFTATALDKNLHPVGGAPAATWGTNDPAVVTIDPASGLATAKSTTLLSTTIVATIAGKQGTASVTVDPNAKPVATITVSGASALNSIDDTAQLTAVARDSGGTVLTGVAFTWSTTDATIASVDTNGLVTAKGNGTATITASANGKNGTHGVTVLQQVASVTAAASTTLSSVGDTLQLTGKDAHAHAVGVPVTWSATGTSVSVSTSGLVTALVNGPSTVSANNTTGATGAGGSIVVTVAQAIHSISVLDPSTVHALGATVRMTALDARGNAVQASTIIWSENKAGAVIALAACSGGCTGAQEVATAVANGTSTVTAKTANDAGLTADITVAQFVSSVSSSVTPAKLRAIGATLTLTAKDANANAVAGVGFVSGATGVATVNASSGVVTAVSNGTATITATGASGDPGKTFDVTVSQQAATLSATSTSFTFINQTAQATAKDSTSHDILSGLTWSACDGTATPPCTPTIVTVSSTGLITAKANGSARVYAGVTGDVPASLSVTVAQALASVAVSPATAIIAVSATQAFTAQPLDSGGTPIAGLGAATWQSGDTTIATIGFSTGVATGRKGGGPITIIATISTTPGTAQLTVAHTIPWLFGNTSANLTIKTGEWVQWNITDGGFHSSTSCSSASPPTGCPAATGFSWNLGPQSGGTLGPVQFTTPGTYVYCCTPHNCGNMKGTIIDQ
jgi:plastocyanin/uncharacterized protein YjdB